MRFLLDSFVVKSFGAFWSGTLAVNLLGSFLAGIVAASSISGATKVLVMSGFLGGLTTFSTFSLQTFTLLKNGEFFTALLFSVANFALGLLAVCAGFWLQKLL